MAATAIKPISALLCIFLGLLINNPAAQAAQNNILYTDERLNTGDSLRYLNHQFIMQEDCNLVLYHGNAPVWASNTGGLGRNCHCRLQNDGNLVVYRGTTPIWASNTGGPSGRNFVLILQRDGNVVLYGPAIWATKTHRGSRAMKIRTEDEREGGPRREDEREDERVGDFREDDESDVYRN